MTRLNVTRLVTVLTPWSFKAFCKLHLAVPSNGCALQIFSNFLNLASLLKYFSTDHPALTPQRYQSVWQYPRIDNLVSSGRHSPRKISWTTFGYNPLLTCFRRFLCIVDIWVLFLMGSIAELSAKLDSLITFEERHTERTIGEGVGVGLGGTGLVGYGLYKRGKSIGAFYPPKRGVKKGTYDWARQMSGRHRCIRGNCAVGAVSVGNQAAISASLMKEPDVREAIAHDLRAKIASKVSKLAGKIRP